MKRTIRLAPGAAQGNSSLPAAAGGSDRTRRVRHPHQRYERTHQRYERNHIDHYGPAGSVVRVEEKRPDRRYREPDAGYCDSGKEQG